MDLALTILAVVGALFFLIGYLAFVRAGFKHHFVTGIISAFPVLNIVTVPALWNKTGKKLILSVIGLLIVAGSWFMGAEKGITKTIALIKGDTNIETVIASSATQTALPLNNGTTIRATGSVDTPLSSLNQRMLDESEMQGLPSRALYKMSFEEIPVANISSLNGRVIRLLSTDHETVEGQVTKITNSSVSILVGSTINEFPLAKIKQLHLMVKKAM